MKTSAGIIGMGLLSSIPGQGAVTKSKKESMKKQKMEALQTDILVIGAGPSGVPAAIAAARNGAQVILVEEDFMPGGAPVDMYVSMLCGGPRLGIYKEMADKLNTGHDPSGKPVDDFNAGIKNGWNFRYMPSAFIQVLWAMISAEKNIRYIGGARAVNTLVKTDRNRNRFFIIRKEKVYQPSGWIMFTWNRSQNYWNVNRWEFQSAG